jgi:hypothetical protein
MSAAPKFDPDALLANFAECNRNIGDIPIKNFIGGVEQLKSIICEL